MLVRNFILNQVFSLHESLHEEIEELKLTINWKSKKLSNYMSESTEQIKDINKENNFQNHERNHFGPAISKHEINCSQQPWDKYSILYENSFIVMSLLIKASLDKIVVFFFFVYTAWPKKKSPSGFNLVNR